MALSELDPQLRAELDGLVASMCKVMNDPKRILILYALREGPHSVGELCELLEVPPSNTSHHLAVLRDRQLVDTERHGNTVVYSLRHPKALDAVDVLRSIMADEFERQRTIREP